MCINIKISLARLPQWFVCLFIYFTFFVPVSGAQKSPDLALAQTGHKELATTYSHRTYRPTTIGAKAFHFRVRNGTGWFHFAMVTRFPVGIWKVKG